MDIFFLFGVREGEAPPEVLICWTEHQIDADKDRFGDECYKIREAAVANGYINVVPLAIQMDEDRLSKSLNKAMLRIDVKSPFKGTGHD